MQDAAAVPVLCARHNSRAAGGAAHLQRTHGEHATATLRLPTLLQEKNVVRFMPGGLAMLHRGFRDAFTHKSSTLIMACWTVRYLGTHTSASTSLSCFEFCLHCFALLQVPLYSKTGFMLLGPSSVEHGQEQWHQMVWQPQEEV
jgi:hypothetical protein